MDVIFIRKCLDGKSFVAAADPEFKGLEGRNSPFSGLAFEETVRRATVENAEIMGLNYGEVAAGVKEKSLFFGKFKIDLGATVVMD